MYFLGIDLGTSSVKIILINDQGQLINSSSKEYPVYYPKSTWAEQNPDDWWKAVQKGIREILNFGNVKKDEIKAIGLSGQMHGLVTLDKNGQVLMPAILWCDQRTEDECNFLNNVIGVKTLSKYTGNKALTGFTAPKILWLKKHREDLYKKISHILLPKDFIRFKLTGEYATDVSDASGTLLFDVENRRWSSQMLDILGIFDEVLPKSFESYEVTGKVSKSAAEKTGLSVGTLVVGGGGDQACGAIGTGIVESEILSVALGTSGVVFACQDNYRVDAKSRLHSFCHANGKWHVMGVMLSAASSLKWWVENINKGMSKLAFDKLLSEAEGVPPGSDGLFFLPYLIGERTPYSDPNAKGAFIGLNITHSRENLTRAILEGVGFGLRDSLEIIRDMAIPISSIRISGGGAHSVIWRKILANIFNLRIDLVNSTEGAAYGAAILAAVGSGVFANVEEAVTKVIRVTDSVFPEEEEVEIYDALYHVYHGFYDDLHNTFLSIKQVQDKIGDIRLEGR